MRTAKEITRMIAKLKAEMRSSHPKHGIETMRYWLIMLYNFASAQALGYDPDSEVGKWWDGKESELDKL